MWYGDFSLTFIATFCCALQNFGVFYSFQKDPHHPLKELAKLALMVEMTLIPAWRWAAFADPWLSSSPPDNSFKECQCFLFPAPKRQESTSNSIKSTKINRLICFRLVGKTTISPKYFSGVFFLFEIFFHFSFPWLFFSFLCSSSQTLKPRSNQWTKRTRKRWQEISGYEHVHTPRLDGQEKRETFSQTIFFFRNFFFLNFFFKLLSIEGLLFL